MLSKNEILTGMQYPMSLVSGPVNTSENPAYDITYQFADTQPEDLIYSFNGWSGLTPEEMLAFRAAFDHVETFLNVRFVEVTESPDPDFNLGKIALPDGVLGLGGFYYYAWGDGSLIEYDGFALFNGKEDLAEQRAWLILHELGHALGLKHPFETHSDSGATHGPLPEEYDSEKYTLMSYTLNPETDERPQSMALFDIFALQDRWGANTEYNKDDTTYTGPRSPGVDVIWDAGGLDRLDASDRTESVKLDLREGEFSQFGDHEDVAIAFGVTIEEAFGGAGDDMIIGNAANNRLLGGAGNDEISGGTGKDTINGGDGDDNLAGESSGDLIFAGAGNDVVFGGGGNDLMYGQDGNDRIVGGSGADELQGQDGDDILTGSAMSDLIYGGAGSDFINGGFGYDRINGGDGGDRFYHLGIADHGSDWIQDYSGAEGDLLLFGQAGASADEFRINFAHTTSAEGERSGDDEIAEAFVIYQPTGQIVWALVDGAGQDDILLKITGDADVFDLLV